MHHVCDIGYNEDITLCLFPTDIYQFVSSLTLMSFLHLFISHFTFIKSHYANDCRQIYLHIHIYIIDMTLYIIIYIFVISVNNE